MTDLLEYLQSKGLQLKTANGANVNTTCWYHGEDPADRGRLYINVDPGSGAYGAFKCFVCDERGGLNKLRAHFGDPPLKTANPQAKPDDLPDDTYLGILHAAAEYYHEQLGEHPEAYEYLRQERGLTHETITRFRLGWATGNGLVTHLSKRFQLEDIQRTGLVNEWGESFFRDKITIPYYVVGQCVQVRGKEIGGKYLTPPGQKARLFNPDAALEERVVIAEGEFDCYSGDTEVLTPEGWVRFDQYAGQPVVQWEEGGKLSLVEPLAFIAKDAERTIKLDTSRNGGVSFHVTPSHRMVSVTPDWSRMRIHAADHQISQQYHIPRVGYLDGPGLGYSDDELRLLLAIQADATLDYRVSDGGQYARFGLKRERKKERLREILDALQIEFSDEDLSAGYTSICFRVPSYLKAFKHLPPEWLTLASLREREFIIDELDHWDGNTVPNRHQSEFSSSIEGNARWVQTLAHTCGRVSTVMDRKNNSGPWKKVSILHNKRSTSWQSIRRSEAGPQRVYCVQVPSSMLLIRHGGQIAVSGNCMLLEQMGYHAMGVPGANTWQDGWTGLLSEAKRVYICFDNDRAGKAGAEKLSTKLGPKSRIVEMPEPLPGQKKIDVSEWVVTYGKGRDDFEFLFSKASGGLLVSVAQAYERWTEVEGNPDLVGLRFNIDQLDAQMRHGLLPGQVFTIIAKTNCLAGDSELIVNRLGTVKFCTLAQLAENFGEWSKLGPVETQHMAEDGSIRTARIKDVWAAGRKQVLQLRTHLGFTVRATAEHRFKVEDGWAQLGDLVVGDHVTVSSQGRGRLDRVVDISPAGEVETYDVEMVKEPHNFVANGFVVHNSGKTLASLNMFHRMALLRPDIKILFFSLEQTRNEWFERARRIHTFYDPWSTIDDTIRWWSDKLWLVDKNRITEDELVSCIDQFEYETGQLPDLVCVDYLGYYARGLRGDEYERTTAAIMGLKSVAKDKQVIVMAPHQVNRTGQFGKHLSADQAKSSGAVEETSDLLMSLFRPDQQVDRSTEDYTGEIHMQILKSRDGPTGSEIVFQFAPKTLAIVPNTDPRVSRLLRERVWARNGQSWEQCLYRYRTGDESTMFLDPAEVERVIRMTKSEYMANKNT